jgi:hypothetical protein
MGFTELSIFALHQTSRDPYFSQASTHSFCAAEHPDTALLVSGRCYAQAAGAGGGLCGMFRVLIITSVVGIQINGEKWM